jgi:hypothetical protein
VSVGVHNQAMGIHHTTLHCMKNRINTTVQHPGGVELSTPQRKRVQ